MNAPEYVVQQDISGAKLLKRVDEPRWTTTNDPMYPNEYRVVAEGNLNDMRELAKRLREATQ